MQLHYNVASPFVRKVMAVAIETGLSERIEPVKRLPSPVAPVGELNADNPLGKIPCLVTDDGAAIRSLVQDLEGAGKQVWLGVRPTRYPA